MIDDGLRDIVISDPTVVAIREYAREAGMVPLRYDGLRKVREGITTVEEVFRVSDEGWVPKKS